MKPRTQLRIGIAVALLVLLGFGVKYTLAKMKGPDHGIPTVRVTRGNIDLKVYITGQLRTPNTSILMAPPVGGTLQIVKFDRTGDAVKAGDVVLEFDPSEQEYNVEQAQSNLDQADQQITKIKADSAISTSKDQVDLLHAQFDVRRAELDVSQNELKSAIDAKKNDLALEEAKRRLAQLQDDTKSRAASNDANLAVYVAQRNKALLDMKLAQDRIASMQIKAAISGLFARKGNTNGVFFFGPGMSVPEYQEGDQTYPGSAVATIMDVSQMEVFSRVPETSRADINVGDAASIQIDSIPNKTFPAKVKNIAGLASGGEFGGDSTRRFDATFQLDQPDAQLRPGQTTHVIVQGAQLKGVLYLPRQALFIRAGKPVVFARTGKGFEPRVVTIKHMSESQVVIEDLPEGTEVALVNPEAAETAPGAAASATSGAKAAGK
jgi:multidrug efflux pump subunit AcrA (membrane-fusion protein)